MYLLEILTVVLNIALAVYIAGKCRTVKELIGENRRIQGRIEQAAAENTRIVNIILGELETKMALHAQINKTGSNDPKPKNSLDKTGLAWINNAAGEKDRTKDGTKDRTKDKSKETGAENNLNKIVYMQKQGLSVGEIAEKLKISQGEVKLKINLHEKMSPREIRA